jgi:D-alanyl-D-alanine carboxypeptidase (penicillin-binding protein 5/6)
VAWIHGVKTGHTLGAGYVLLGAGTRRGMTLISAVLGTASQADRDAATLALLDYGFENFTVSTPVRAGSVLATAGVKYRPHAHARLLAARTFEQVLPLSAHLETRVQAPRELTGPLRRGTRLGQVVVLDGGRVVARIPLILAAPLAAVSPLTILAHFLTRPTTLVALFVVLGAIVALAAIRRERARRGQSAGLKPA